MDQQAIILGGLILLAVAAVAGAMFAPTPKERSNKRLAALDSRGNAKRASASAANESIQREKRRKVAEALSRVEEQNQKAKKKKRYSLEQQFEQAGLTFTVPQFYIGSAVLAAALGLIGVISGQQIYVTIGFIFIGGLGLPRWFIAFARKRRQKKFGQEFSNAIDVIVRGVKSGLPVNECLKIISTEAPKPVSEEFHQLTEGMRIGLTLEQTLDRMHERMPLPEVRFFGIVLMIQQQTGGNLAEALGNLASVLRGRKNMEGKIKALSAEAKASAMIIGALPFLVMGAVKVASPDYLDPLFVTKPGNFILLAAGFWFTLGIVVMRNMTQIKV
ncbi:MAG: pilus assembly protein [Alphaproteobacteria bacterium]|nr:pilus assembly protein [Alphaproteobacteria bacterium]